VSFACDEKILLEESSSMKRSRAPFLLACVALVLLCSVAAGAQTPRVFVTAHGNDANLCTATAPCRTITHALGVVDTYGEVVIAEDGEYDNFIVTKSVTVTAAPGVYAGITANKLDGVDIYRLGIDDSVTLRNLTIKATYPAFAPAATNGIYNDSVGNLNIEACNISGMTNGIWTSAPGKMIVHDTTVRDCTVGIYFYSPAGYIINGLVDNSRLERNNVGVNVSNNARATIHNCAFFRSGGHGVKVFSTLSGIQAEANIDGSTFHSNGTGITSGGNSGGTGLARISNNIISKNLTGVSVGSGTIYSLQNNIISGNTTIDISGSLTAMGFN
jgi:hypothetical protein